METRRELHVLDGHQSNVNSVRFSPNGKIVVTASNDNSAGEGCGTWRPERNCMSYRGHESAVNTAEFLTAGTVATISLDKTARLWDVASGTEVKVFEVINLA